MIRKKKNFYTLLDNDKKYFLPSIIDKYYHRNTLTSNNAETIFSVVKRNLKRKYPKSMVINLLINLSMKWLIQSIKKPISIPLSLQGRVNEFIGQTALDYIIEEETTSLRLKKKECNCNNIPIGLPCCHYFLTHKTESIEVPIEYLRLKYNYIMKKKKELTNSENEITQIDMEEVTLHFNKAVEELNKINTEESHRFKNEITYYILEFIMHGYKFRKFRRARWQQKVDKINFSASCTAHRKKWKSRNLSLRTFVVNKKLSTSNKKTNNDKKPKKN